jgi:hypothetical protein
MKMIERLRKQQRRWPTARLVVLFDAALALSLACFLAHFAIKHFYQVSMARNGLLSMVQNSKLPADELAKSYLAIQDADRQETLEMGIALLICLFFFIFALWATILVLTNWHGKAERTLLLKLLDATQKKSP